MCLLVFSFREHPTYPLIFAGNRDEFHARPTAPADFWDEHPELLAGRDLKAGGTWLGVTRAGRFATVTNYREPNERRTDVRSRGEIVTEFLLGEHGAPQICSSLQARALRYDGFNLLLGNSASFYYYSNRTNVVQALDPGTYGLSNGVLDTPWPKVRRAKALFRDVIDRSDLTPNALLQLLADTRRAGDAELPRTGVGLDWERRLSSIFISGVDYGTRASTAVLFRNDGWVTFVERSFGPGGTETGTRSFEFRIESPEPAPADEP